ncbi:MAG: type II toxin-antitoxin system VapC family toxin [Actinobacteria bacterium]|nr:type II toxin-antitoxin system VapC family toxin [Actinomycetota bacterium]
MTVVLASNVLVAMVTADRRAEAVGRHVQVLAESGEALHAPRLLRYEVANAITRKIVAGEIDTADASRGWRQIVAMPIVLHELDDGPAAIGIALRLRRESAYDAAYVALAQELDAELLTLDGPLARNAASIDLPVRLLQV